MSELTCSYCRAENPDGNAFCGACGARIHSEEASDIARVVDRAVEEQMAAAFDSRLKDQLVVEVEVAERIAERTMKWAKLAGFFIAIPAALLAGLLAFVGIETYSDLEKVTNTLDKTRDEIASAQAGAQEANSQAQELLTKIRAQESDLRREVDGVRRRVAKVVEGLRGTEKRLGQQEEAVSKKFIAVEAQQEVLDINVMINTMSDAAAVDLLHSPPVEIPADIDKIIKLRTGGKSREEITDGKTAKALLRMINTLLDRVKEVRDPWKAAFVDAVK